MIEEKDVKLLKFVLSFILRNINIIISFLFQIATLKLSCFNRVKEIIINLAISTSATCNNELCRRCATGFL